VNGCSVIASRILTHRPHVLFLIDVGQDREQSLDLPRRFEIHVPAPKSITPSHDLPMGKRRDFRVRAPFENLYDGCSIEREIYL